RRQDGLSAPSADSRRWSVASRASRRAWRSGPVFPTRSGGCGSGSRVRAGQGLSQDVPGNFPDLLFHGEFPDLGEEFFLPGLVERLGIAGMRAEGFRALGDEVVHPLFDLGYGQIMGPGEFAGS